MKNYVKEHPYIALGLLFALLFLAGNWLMAVTDSAESNYALTAKEMIHPGTGCRRGFTVITGMTNRFSTTGNWCCPLLCWG